MAGHKINRRQMLLRTATWGATALATRFPRLRGASRNEPALRARPFDLQDVRLLEGPFKDAMQRDAAYLLKLEPDRFLSNFRDTAGLKPKAPVYGGWESKVGRMLGHYLSACSMMYASTGEPQFLQRANYMVDELEACQRANANGYVGGIPDGKRVFSELAKGRVEVEDSSLDGVHAPWYMMHKEMAGLRDAWLLTGNAKAKHILVQLSDWVGSVAAGMNDDQFQRMLECEYGGMNEVLADVSAMTGEKKYLELAARFNHRAVLDPLKSREDPLDGLHANTQIPKVVGMARQFELGGDPSLRAGAEFFWQRVTQKRSYVTGGNSDDEHFFPVGEMDRHLSAASSETCNTYNMLKLTRHLFGHDPRAEYADFFERALYNHILGSQDPETGMMTYFYSMKPGHFKTFSTPLDSFWCCVGTGMENHAKYGDSIYFEGRNELFVNLFIASELTWKAQRIKVRQETRFPEEETSRLMFTLRQPTRATVNFRHPYWATSGMEVAVNGKSTAAKSEPASFFKLERTWRDGDVVEIRLPMKLRVEAMPDNKKFFALMDGPLVLAGALGTEGYKSPMPFAGNNELEYEKVPDPPVPALRSSDRPVEGWVKPIRGQSLTFMTEGASKSPGILLRPTYALNRERYTIYWKTSD